MKTMLPVLLLLATHCYAYDRESAALQILTGKPVGPENCFVDTNGDGVRDGTTAGISMAAIRAITNRADVVALCQQNDAATAAAEALRLQTPITFDQSIQFLGAAGPAMRGTDGHWYQPVPDPEAGDWLAIPRTGSPWHPDATFTNTAAAVIAERKAHRAAIRAIKLDLDQCATNLAQVAVSIDAINTSATGTLGVAIAATTGTTKTALTATRNVLGDLKAAVRNLRAGVEQNRQACEKLRREVR